MNPILDTPKFLFTDLGTAVPDVDMNIMRGWLSRGYAILSEFDRVAGGGGKRVLFTLRTIYEFAIASQLVGLSIPSPMAFGAARYFSQRSVTDPQGRNPDTLLHDKGSTLLIVWKGGDQIKEFDRFEPYVNTVECYDFDPKAKNNSSFFDLLFRNQTTAAAAIVHCNPVLEAVDKALDVRRETPKK